MPAPHTGIDTSQILRIQRPILLSDLRQLPLHLRLLPCLFQIIFPLPLQLLIGVSLHPQPSQRILHHIPDNPIRRKQLSSSGNIFLGNLHILLKSRKHLILFPTVIILIQPPDDLHLVFPVLLRNQRDHLLRRTALPQQIIRKQKLRIILNPLEHTRQYLVQRITLDNNQILKQLFIFIPIFQGIDPLHVQAVQFHIDSFRQDLGLKLIFIISKYPHMGRQITIYLHKPKSAKPVKPCIGNLLHDLLIALLPNLSDQSPPLPLLSPSQHLSPDAVSLRVPISAFRNVIQSRSLRHTGDQFSASPYRVFLYSTLIHRTIPFPLSCHVLPPLPQLYPVTALQQLL